MKKYIATGLVSAGIVAFSLSALAAGNSTPGLDRYMNNLGRQQASVVGAQCGSGASSGSFGYFGKNLNMAGGANGYQTGLNNSGVCGNRQ
ncbi:MAG: hypothetical protein PHP25_02070 [Candidatus Moranbacteria bacterium]|nr:hypothetical protein [Candidatus Moranbacteria bacterium]